MPRTSCSSSCLLLASSSSGKGHTSPGYLFLTMHINELEQYCPGAAQRRCGILSSNTPRGRQRRPITRSLLHARCSGTMILSRIPNLRSPS